MAAAEQGDKIKKGKQGVQKPLNLGEEIMCKAFRLAGAAVMLGSSIFSVAEARAIDLTGAWAGHEDLCSQVFTKKDGKVTYAEFSELFGSGFIIDGDGRKSGDLLNQVQETGGRQPRTLRSLRFERNDSGCPISLKIIDDMNIPGHFQRLRE